MILIRDRDELKRHLEHRMVMLRAQWRSEKVYIGEVSLRMQMVGIKEALECIEAWEANDANSNGQGRD